MSNLRSEAIEALSVKALLQDDANYLVPMYQRNYAWGEAEINQLIQDIVDYKEKIMTAITLERLSFLSVKTEDMKSLMDNSALPHYRY